MNHSTGLHSDVKLWSPKRRDFLRAIGLGTTTVAVGGLYGCGGGDDTAEIAKAQVPGVDLVMDDAYWRDTRELFTRNGNITYFDVDPGRVRPQVSIDRFSSSFLVGSNRGVRYSAFEQERELVAESFGIDRSSLAFSITAADALRSVLFGLSLQPGDVVVTTNQEHPNTRFSLGMLESALGIKCFYVDTLSLAKESPESCLSAIERVINSLRSSGQRVRVLVWSSPSYASGLQLPVKQMAEVAKKNNLISICDAAQLIGMMQFDFRKCGVDFLCGSGHKWQCGVNAVGLLFVGDRVLSGEISFSNERQDLVSSEYYGEFNRPTSPQLTDRLSVVDTSRLGVFDALVASCQFWNKIGRGKIQSQITTMNGYLRRKLLDTWPSSSVDNVIKYDEAASGMTTFNPLLDPVDAHRKDKVASFVSSLRQQYGMHVKCVEWPSANGMDTIYPVRISTPIWVTSEDVDNLCSAMDQLAHKMV